MEGFAQMLARYGQEVRLCYGDGRPDGSARAFFQAIDQGQGELPTPLGLVSRERYLYLGEPGVSPADLGEGYLLWNGRKFRVESARGVYVGKTLSHWRAVAVPEE